MKLIDHEDADVAAFAAELLADADAVSSFPIPTWLALLATRNPAVTATVADAFRKHVDFARVTATQAIELALRAPVPVAALGLDILLTREFRTPADRALLARLSAAECAALADAIARFALPKLNRPGGYDIDDLTGFFDSRFRTMRSGAFAALTPQSPADTDPAFWSRLFESPYDDVRTELVARLKTRSNLPGASSDSLASLWTNVLLSIHRGGRAKLSALRQISDHIRANPSTTRILLPVLAIAIRSVRAPEARHGLAAIVAATQREPSLLTRVAEAFPDLQLDATVGVP
ncbi:MAG: hypothetical protein QM770_23815 [Tepidisphaeraceae bacterium]